MWKSLDSPFRSIKGNKEWDVLIVDRKKTEQVAMKSVIWGSNCEKVGKDRYIKKYQVSLNGINCVNAKKQPQTDYLMKQWIYYWNDT